MRVIDINGRPVRLVGKAAGSGLLIVSSPDVPGLHLAERTWDQIISEAKAIVPVLDEMRAHKDRET